MRPLLSLLIAPLLAAAAKYSDSYCSKTVCVHAELNKTLSIVNYKVSAANEDSARNIGWVAVGFGTKMANADMVVLWANNASSMTLSHRNAPGHEMPKIVAHPSRVATPLPHLSTMSQQQLEFAFEVPFNEKAAMDHVFAASPARPTSSDVDAPIQFHSLDFGVFTLNYIGAKNDPLRHQRGLSIAHGVLMWLGFLVALPIGALIPRFTRTSTPGPKWFKAHWITQGCVAAPLIIVAAILAIVAVSIQRNGEHFDDAHKQTGLIVLILFLLQIYGGYYIHTYKSEAFKIKGRPLVNYLHPILGIVIVALAFIQVHSGYANELALVGVNRVSKAVDVIFYLLLAVVILLYAIGLSLLPKQYAQEEQQRSGGTIDERAPLIRPVSEGEA